MKKQIPFFILLLLLPALFIISCKDKSNNASTKQCSNLTNDPLAANDSGWVTMPTAFTPNNDGRNDQARPMVKNITNLDFKIFDDNNNLVFSTNTPMDGWKTTITTKGVTHFTYRIQATTTQNHVIGRCGSLYAIISCAPSGFGVANLLFEDQVDPEKGQTVNATSERVNTCN